MENVVEAVTVKESADSDEGVFLKIDLSDDLMGMLPTG